MTSLPFKGRVLIKVYDPRNPNNLPCRGTSLVRKAPLPPQDHHRALGIVLLEGARGALFLMSEVPVYLAYMKAPPPRTLQEAYAWGLTVVFGGGGAFLTSEVPLHGRLLGFLGS